MYNNRVSNPVTIRTAMGGRRGYGPTHSQSLEPILSSIPGIKIISPTYYHNPGELLEYTTLNESGIKIFCEYKMNYPKELLNQTNCQEGISVKYSDGKYPTVYLSNSEFDDPEILIISHGGNAILIEDLLMELLIEHELAVLANFPSIIKPVVFDELFNGIENCKMIIVIEESPKSFGWGNEIVAYIAESGLAEGKSIARVGADESPIPSSTLLENKVLPSKNDIIDEMIHYHPRGDTIITAYVDGVNEYIRQTQINRDLLPIEFDILGIRPQKWTPEVVISRHQGLLGNIGS